jgi:dihydropteroate synthase type 2
VIRNSEDGNRKSEGSEAADFRFLNSDFRFPALFGILNITDDSFSDAGKYLAPDAALAQARHLMKDADALDIGAASSNPRSKGVAHQIEIGRLAPIVRLAKEEGWPVSIDSFNPETQIWALDQNVAYINDIQGFPYPDLYPRLAASRAKLIVMHAVHGLGPAQPVDVDPASIMDRIVEFFSGRIEALTRAGIARERLILDPGMGLFVGRKKEVSLTVLRRLPDLKAAFGLPVLVSVSRKSFLRKLVGRDVAGIGPATLAAELYAADQGIDAIRTHDPAALRDALTIWAHIQAGNP